MEGFQYLDVMQKSCLLIISGPDKAGKGWLGERLHKRMCAHYMALPKPMHLWDKSLQADEKRAVHHAWLAQWYGYLTQAVYWYGDMRKQGAMRLIIDRFYPDEWAYSKVFGRDTYGEEAYDHIDQISVIAGAKIAFVVEGNMEVVAQRWDDQYPIEDYERLVRTFAAFVQQIGVKSKRFSTTDDDVVERVSAWALS